MFLDFPLWNNLTYFISRVFMDCLAAVTFWNYFIATIFQWTCWRKKGSPHFEQHKISSDWARNYFHAELILLGGRERFRVPKLVSAIVYWRYERLYGKQLSRRVKRNVGHWRESAVWVFESPPVDFLKTWNSIWFRGTRSSSVTWFFH